MKRYFILRVELHDLPRGVDSRPIYDFLHDELTRKGYQKTIPARSGGTYQLPDAVYTGWVDAPITEFTASNASNLAKAAIDATIAFVKRDYPLTTMYGSDLAVEAVTNGNNTEVYWHGLEQA